MQRMNNFALALLAVNCLIGIASAQDTAMVEEVIVTGSRLRTSNVTSPTPLIQIGAEEITSRGIARVEDVVNILPSVFAQIFIQVNKSGIVNAFIFQYFVLVKT